VATGSDRRWQVNMTATLFGCTFPAIIVALGYGSGVVAALLILLFVLLGRMLEWQIIQRINNTKYTKFLNL
jgi:uncharacterized integral membrane protein